MHKVPKLVVLVIASSCSVAAAQTMDPELVKRSAEWDAAMEAKDAAKLASFYMEDALTFSEGAPAIRESRAARQKTFEAMLKRNPLAMSTKILEAATSGNIGYTVSTYSSPPFGPNKKARAGHWLQIWKRVEGQWLIAYGMFADGPSK